MEDLVMAEWALNDPDGVAGLGDGDGPGLSESMAKRMTVTIPKIIVAAAASMEVVATRAINEMVVATAAAMRAACVATWQNSDAVVGFEPGAD